MSPTLARMLTVIHDHGYQSTVEELRKSIAFYPGLRPVLVARPNDLSNGFRCANVVFFSHGRYVGRDSAACHLYPEISWGGSDEISVVYPRYARSDALCCSSLNPERVIYRLANGHIERVSGIPPKLPG